MTSRPRTVGPDIHSTYPLLATSDAPLEKATRWFVLRSSSLRKTYINYSVLYRLLFNRPLAAERQSGDLEVAGRFGRLFGPVPEPPTAAAVHRSWLSRMPLQKFRPDD